MSNYECWMSIEGLCPGAANHAPCCEGCPAIEEWEKWMESQKEEEP